LKATPVASARADLLRDAVAFSLFRDEYWFRWSLLAAMSSQCLEAAWCFDR
jgi:hypothetical protein